MTWARDPEDLARRALRVFIEAAGQAIASRGRFHTAISGGRTPVRFFELLGTDPQAKALAWDRIHVFWTDERYVPADHADSNYRLAHDTFLTRVSIPEAHIHRVPTDLPTLCDAVRSYEQTLEEVFHPGPDQVPQFDLITLGLGEDGHIASLFPYSYAIVDCEGWVCLVHRPEGQHARVTLNSPVLCEAGQLMVLVSGRAKAQILKEVCSGEPEPLRYPIQVLWPVLDKVTWLVDQEADSQAILGDV